MKFSLFPNNTSRNGFPIMDAYEYALKQAGETIMHHDMNADVAVIWSVLFQGRMKANKEVWEHYRKQNKPVIVLEVGAIKRNTTWRAGINGITGDAYHGPTNNPKDRFDLFKIELAPWVNRSKGKIVICGQHDDSAQWIMHNDTSVAKWIYDTIVSWRAKDQESTFIIRPHPRNRFHWASLGNPDHLGYTGLSDPKHISGTYDDFNFPDLLDQARLIINYNSNPAIEAVLKGIPVMTHESSRCWPVANPIGYTETIRTPNRQQWANDLCYQEWTESEIRLGEPFRRIRPKLEELVK